MAHHGRTVWLRSLTDRWKPFLSWYPRSSLEVEEDSRRQLDKVEFFLTHNVYALVKHLPKTLV
jgi:hypothetical protein